MAESPAGEVTRLLRELRDGRSGAQERLMPLVYDELRSLARGYMRRERPDHTLQPTALVHEAYLRLAGQQEVEWQNRAHFLGIAAQAMRRILVDHARRHRSEKRGGGRKVTLAIEDEADPCGPGTEVDLIALDEALERLGEMDPRALSVVELRYFAGLSVEESAELLQVSTATVKRDWRDARLWLKGRLQPEGRT